jgi:RNA polymerase sigma-70 factor, ECF subfamily
MIVTMSMDPDDRQLANKVKNGDIQAFNTLVSLNRRKLYSVIYRMTRDHHKTDDLLQETFVKLYTSIDKYDDRYPFYPWLYRIAVNLTLNCIKKESKRKWDSSLEEDREEKFKQYADQHDLFSPEINIARKERDGKILDALQKISPAYRAALILRVFECLSYKEIADVLDCNVGTVMSRLNRARGQLKDMLGDYLMDEITAES